MWMSGRNPIPAFANLCARLPARFSMIMPGSPSLVKPAG